ncbi:hypothetical protein JR316_0003143 [Psilocybe cubensis]|uniref:Uncharacterized protein n=1 Tax=Psilocybe cubensis TaxID=181762 RepID=A0ACB8H7B5_PSICU|nr:hypothetical protein JR316_0003143 [Psilocybe cubensis]KAH9483673.1 hypothetical protein JR316_0003143 [Psilocybe cubensis]
MGITRDTMKGSGTMRTTTAIPAEAHAHTHTTELEQERWPKMCGRVQRRGQSPLSIWRAPAFRFLGPWRAIRDANALQNGGELLTLDENEIIRLLSILLFMISSVLPGAHANQNVTVDDQDPSISYSPQGAWGLSANSSLDIGGAHMLTQNPNGTAVFRFTGIAVYYLSPLWPYTVNTAVSLDSGNATLVDLVDHSRPTSPDQGPETVQSRVVWSATGLKNGPHELTMFVGAGQPFAVVDALIYTNTDPATPSSASGLPSTTDRVIASSTSSPNSGSSKSKNVVPVVLGTIFGILGLLLLLLAVWFYFRNKRKKRPISEWTVDGTAYSGAGGDSGPNGRYVYPTPSHPQGKAGYDLSHSGGYYRNGYGYENGNGNGNGHGHGYPMEQTQQGTFQNTRYAHVGMPAPSIPAHDIGMTMSPGRYKPGDALSTITEKSTPSRMGDGGARTPVGVGAYSPASVMTSGSALPGPPTDMGEYYAASPSMGSTAVMSLGEYGADPAGQGAWDGDAANYRRGEQRPAPRHYKKPVGNYL